MKAEMSAQDAVGQVFEEWKNDFSKYLIPSVEFFLVLFISILLLSTISTIIYLIILVPYIFYSASDGMDYFIILYSIQMVTSLITNIIAMIIRAILQGGTIRTVRNMQGGNDYDFFDIVKTGWKGKWSFIKIVFTVAVTRSLIALLIFTLPLIVFIPAFILITYSNPIFAPLFVIVFLLFILVVAFLISVILIPMEFFSFTSNLNEGTGGIKSVSNALSYMRSNFKDWITLAGVFLLFGLVGGIIPYVGLLIQSAGYVFMYQALCRMFPDPLGLRVRAKPFTMR